MQEVRNFARFYGLFKKLPKVGVSEGDLKGQLVAEFTNGRTHSLRDMSRVEYERLCEALEREVGGEARMVANLVRRAELKKCRSSCLHLMQRMGIDTTDWSRVNAFCMDARIAGRTFRELDVDALEGLAVKLRAIRRKGGLRGRDVKAADAEEVRRAVEEHSDLYRVSFNTDGIGEA